MVIRFALILLLACSAVAQPFTFGDVSFVGSLKVRTNPAPAALDYDAQQTFESALSGSWSEVDNSSRMNVADTDAAKNGTAGCSYAADVTDEAYVKFDDGTARDSVTVGLWYRVGQYANYAGLRRFLQFWNDAQGNVCFVADGRGAGGNERVIGWHLSSGTVDVSDNTWYWVACKFARNGTSSLAIYSTLGTQVGSTLTGAAPDFAVDEIQLKAEGVASTTPVCFDDIHINYTTAPFPYGP